MIKDLPGNIVELGVYQCQSLLTWSIFMETFVTNDRFRKVYGFDSFEGLQHFSPKDGPSKNISGAEKVVGGYKAEFDFASTLVDL